MDGLMTIAGALVGALTGALLAPWITRRNEGAKLDQIRDRQCEILENLRNQEIARTNVAAEREHNRRLSELLNEVYTDSLAFGSELSSYHPLRAPGEVDPAWVRLDKMRTIVALHFVEMLPYIGAFNEIHNEYRLRQIEEAGGGTFELKTVYEHVEKMASTNKEFTDVVRKKIEQLRTIQ
ncbi:hypothetical protein [Duganella vulcania]|uniref:Uncharacterized protein n=1 Tax=Duganella vulcania TaxID=2692166 RepID=A0A845GE49_9BURK|nr:hypothetical protein [Duganella vulcania]MYM92564.1 hypothetical protein [Duganella vulcania]